MLTGKKKFRELVPTKREITYNPSLKYGSYKKILMEDFNGRCGYCDSYHGIVKKDFHIDHFVPQRIIEKFQSHTHLLNDYNNLILSCPTCNSSKSGKWPTENPDINLVNNKGFINPTDTKYDEHFYRDSGGQIFPEESLETSVFMYKELKLYLRKHKVVWSIEYLLNILREYRSENEKSEKDELVSELLEYLYEHFEMKDN